ncbi:MAG: trypsin-like serine protease [Casimicrobiaceae bacterium]
MNRRILTLAASFVALTAVAMPALAITDGKLDGEDHPYVVLLLMEENGKPRYRCSGTLLSPTVLLTAGHCAGAPGEFSGMRVFTQSDVQAGKLNGTNNFPFAGPNSVEAVAWHAHPLYPTAPFFLHDVGVVILQAPGVTGLTEYGTLPTVNMLDSLAKKRGRQDTTFTAVGYGLQASFPDAASWKTEAARTRYQATPHLLQINTGFTGNFSLLLSNNHATGGTCFGDSGGPNFIGSGPTETTIIAAVTSYGINGNCAGTGGVFRLDRQDVLDFIHLYF